MPGSQIPARAGNDATNAYFRSIWCLRRVEPAEEVALARAWRERGCKRSRDRLIMANLRLVIALVRPYTGRGVGLDELIAEGNVGLIHAVDNFDPDAGCRLSTYAAYWIRQSIARAFASASVRGQLNQRDRHDLTALEREVNRFALERGRPPTTAELAAALGWRKKKVQFVNMLLTATTVQGLPEAGTNKVNLTKPPIDPADPPSTRSDSFQQVKDLMTILAPNERRVVECSFGLEGGWHCKPRSVADELGQSLRQVQRLKQIAVDKMRRRAVLTAHTGATREQV